MAMTRPTSDQITFQNSVALPGQLAVDTNTLFVDATNNRVGVGTTTPATSLHVVGNATISGNATINGTISGSTVGALASSLLPSGCILQVIHFLTTNSTTLSTSTAVGTFISTSLSATITPKRSNSQIILLVFPSIYMYGTAIGGASANQQIVRSIGGGSETVVANSASNYCPYHDSAAVNYGIIWSNPSTYVDTPSTTSAVTYTTQLARQNANSNIVQNYASTRSTMILVEVAV